MVDDSRLSGFYNLPREERINKLMKLTGLDGEALGPLIDPGRVEMGILDHMIENVIGSMILPLGIATNFKINGSDYLVPMAIEEPSVVAAASHAAKIARVHGGFTAIQRDSVMIAQIQAVNVPAPHS
ncbi:MAG: 3-hydroxy-3-methylglutaryl-CoA reductase, partial [Promethearchaeia archaeon]